MRVSINASIYGETPTIQITVPGKGGVTVVMAELTPELVSALETAATESREALKALEVA